MSTGLEKRPQAEGLTKKISQPAWIAFGLLIGLLVVGYWNSLKEAAAYWEGPQYSHGWLIPLFTVVLLWMRQQPLVEVPPIHRWYGVGILASSLLLRIIFAERGLDIPDMVTFVPAVLGVIWIIGGWPMFRWAGPAAAFLIFMFPLPWSVEQALLNPLQTLATRVSTYVLQTLGFGAYYEGNRIQIEEVQLGVVDACSGLRMTTIFLALSVAIVLIADRPWWENLVIVLSAVPIALTVNVIRITVTGILHVVATAELANLVFHDLAGWLMVPLALLLLWIEVSILSNLFVEVEEELPIVPRPELAPTGGRK
ncbi:MAG: exosortase/archaeosortase family protein [Thermoguttaceae bacterium]|nr:exosortase/archaeosortase family protein [Thermoguttaceae bacterium]MDW8038870.1 exosortase/archaeosortase family protein [Thermoguttaceae bacterium]